MNKSVVILIGLSILGILIFSMLTYEAPSEDYVNLKAQFETYLNHDLSSDDQLINYMNTLNYEHSLENVAITYHLSEGDMVQSGVIVDIDGINIDVITQEFNLDNENDVIEIIDYKNQKHIAEIVAKSDVYPVMILSYTSFDARDLEVPTFTDVIPLNGEIISSVSSLNHIYHQTSLGIFLEDIDGVYYEIDMIESMEVVGSSIYDVNHDLVGIRIYNNDKIVVLLIQALTDFIQDNT